MMRWLVAAFVAPTLAVAAAAPLYQDQMGIASAAKAKEPAGRCEAYCRNQCRMFSARSHTALECHGCTADSVGAGGCFPGAQGYDGQCDSYCKNPCKNFAHAADTFKECNTCTVEKVGENGCFPGAAGFNGKAASPANTPATGKEAAHTLIPVAFSVGHQLITAPQLKEFLTEHHQARATDHNVGQMLLQFTTEELNSHLHAEYPGVALPAVSTQAEADVGSVVRKAAAALSGGKWQQAVVHFTEVVGKQPDHPLPFFNRFYANLRLKRYRAALKDLDAALARSPRFKDALLARAALLRLTGRCDAAQKDHGALRDILACRGTSGAAAGVTADNAGKGSCVVDSEWPRAVRTQPNLKPKTS
jgi:hypothetical protein